tara:strand:- start:230 stop:625 length:396 start_codon:yes stop_codon:yes gene_type:complete
LRYIVDKFSFISIIFFSIFFISCYNAERNCTDFHYGEFEFKTYVEGVEKISKFKRNNDFEIEIFEDKTDSAKIKWISDCEFILTKINPLNNQEKKPISIKIISTYKNSYTFEYHLVGNKKNTQRGVVSKIN